LVSELTYENVALREDLQRARLTIERLEGEIENLYRAAQAATRHNLELTKRLQAIADEADADIQLAAARRAEQEAIEL
jgi:predicted RNase H-like nuclease (RuvC/YqgF family)